MWIWVLLLLGGMPLLAGADGEPAKRVEGDGFEIFCDQWMQKLAARQRANVAALKFRSEGRGVVGEYTGYARTPIRCESRVRQPGVRGVGVLVYHEIRYRQRGTDHSAARASEPEVVERVEVTEVFRYDGTRWSY